MIFRKRGCQRPNIERKDGGQVEWVTGIFFLIILGVLLCTQLQLASWRASSLYLEDALAASNLASALIDVEEYGRSHRVVIADPSAAYDIYCDAVKANLQLDENWQCANRHLISGPVEIVDYIVYNVSGGRVTASRVGRSGVVTEEWSGVPGILEAPDKTVVERTGVYSEIAFSVESFFGLVVPAHKGNLADIWSAQEEEVLTENESKENDGV